MPDRQLFSRNAASAAHFRSARVNYVRLIESADRRFMCDRIAGIFFQPTPPLRRRTFLLVSLLAFPAVACQPSFCTTIGISPETPFRRKVFEKSHRCPRCPILDIASDQTHRTQTHANSDLILSLSHVRDFRLKLHSHKNFRPLYFSLCSVKSTYASLVLRRL